MYSAAWGLGAKFLGEQDLFRNGGDAVCFQESFDELFIPMPERKFFHVYRERPEINLFVRLPSDELKVVKSKRFIELDQRVAKVQPRNRPFSTLRHITQVQLEGKPVRENVKLFDSAALKCRTLIP